MTLVKLAFPEEIWTRVLAKTKSTCTYCGKNLSPDEYGKCQPIPPQDGAWEVDHWLPRSWFQDAGRADAFINLWPACCGCNDEKSDRVDGEAYVLERVMSNLTVNRAILELLVDQRLSK